MSLSRKKYRPVNMEERQFMQGSYTFGTGNSFIDGNFISGPDIERAVNGRPLPDEAEDDRIW